MMIDRKCKRGTSEHNINISVQRIFPACIHLSTHDINILHFIQIQFDKATNLVKSDRLNAFVKMLVFTLLCDKKYGMDLEHCPCKNLHTKFFNKICHILKRNFPLSKDPILGQKCKI